MNKIEISVVVLLFVLLLGWGFLNRPNPAHQPPPAPATEETGTEPTVAPADAQVGAPVPQSVSNEAETAAEEVPTPPEVAPAPVTEPVHAAPEQTVTLANEELAVAVSSWGGGIVSVELRQFAETQEQDSGPIVLDFAALPALSIADLPGFGTNQDFTLSGDAEGGRLAIRREDPGGLTFSRSLSLTNGYLIEVTDVFSNRADNVSKLPSYGLNIGPMEGIKTKSRVRGITYLGLDTLAAAGGEKVHYWGNRDLPRLFGRRGGLFSCAGPSPTELKDRVDHRLQQPVDWAAAKNKFFVQILEPAQDTLDCRLLASRDTSTEHFTILTVTASLYFPERVLEPGESLTRSATYYVGPKKYSRLKKLGHHQDSVMQFGWLTWLCKPMLGALNAIHKVVRNYGLAIIVLTVIVRILFWPVTHKSTESMKKMQKIQPKVQGLRQKYKDKPQKMNQEVMALYKEHKVNPMAGCLPIVVQIPVFISLFKVLRSAVELRFAGFLWIRDLSEPEGLLAGVVPWPGSGINILPLFMTATMLWQQQLTPSAGDPQQKKMMMLMPLVFLFIFYPMPSALVLYWSVSQLLAIAQLLFSKYRDKAREEV